MEVPSYFDRASNTVQIQWEAPTNGEVFRYQNMPPTRILRKFSFHSPTLFIFQSYQ